jgi:hypothetical protein
MRSKLHNSDAISLVVVLAVIAALFAVIAVAGATGPHATDPGSATLSAWDDSWPFDRRSVLDGAPPAPENAGAVETVPGLMSGDLWEMNNIG